MKEAAALFSALSDETRLRILALLTHGELCVCHVEAILRMPQSKVSRHLMVLRHAGLVSWRREGTWIYYALPDPKDDLHARVIDCLRTCLQENPVIQADIERITGCLPSVGTCCDDSAPEERDKSKEAS
ncbi:MAG: ArsR family transcriptional regulator [Candidatus Latescibacteria bacterium]|nr:ArsR family transcriptional regulator [Candidatus Latescibacterota bacterium]